MSKVKLPYGFAEGQIKEIEGTKVIEFINIPYCKAPINEKRFIKSEPIEAVADKYLKVVNFPTFQTCPPQCILSDSEGSNVDEELWNPIERQDDDCLFVNVWVPVEKVDKIDKQFGVLVWIYGGGFVTGSSSLQVYNGAVLAALENLIVVSFNYRVGLLGFLNLNYSNICGNQGIWDQVLALRWVHENIELFGGNKDRVVISGNSAGGFSVSLHLLIEQSWPYFSGAIMNSGCCLSDWGFKEYNDSVKRSEASVNAILAKLKVDKQWRDDLTNSEKDEIIEMLRKIDCQEFLNYEVDVSGFLHFGWGPTIDGELVKKLPRQLLEDGTIKENCPIIGLNVGNECTYFMLLSFHDLLNCKDIQSEIHLDYFDRTLQYFPYYPHKVNTELICSVKKQYKLSDFNSNTNTGDNRLTVGLLDEILSYKNFISDQIEFFDFIVEKKKNTLYYLWFNFRMDDNYSQCRPPWLGVMHSDDTFYMFGMHFQSKTEGMEDCRKFSKEYMSMIGKFVNNKEHKLDLPTYAKGKRAITRIDNDGWHKEMMNKNMEENCLFWINIKRKFRIDNCTL